ncbi:unnamed protein product [Caretta caretta]
MQNSSCKYSMWQEIVPKLVLKTIVHSFWNIVGTDSTNTLPDLKGRLLKRTWNNFSKPHERGRRKMGSPVQSRKLMTKVQHCRFWSRKLKENASDASSKWKGTYFFRQVEKKIKWGIIRTVANDQSEIHDPDGTEPNSASISHVLRNQ